MSAADLAAVVVTIAAVAATTVLVVISLELRRTLRSARATVRELQARATLALDALDGAAASAGAELGRVDGLLDRAERISATLEDASRLGYLAVSSPVIKVAALAAGVRHGARRLRTGAPAPLDDPPLDDRALDDRALDDPGRAGDVASTVAANGAGEG